MMDLQRVGSRGSKEHSAQGVFIALDCHIEHREYCHLNISVFRVGADKTKPFTTQEKRTMVDV